MKQKVSKKPCLPGVPTAAHRQPAFTSMRTNQAIGRKRVSENVVAIRSSMLLDPISLVATMAHELGHVILLGGNFLTHDTPDQEPMTDLLTGFTGLGIFIANSAARFMQFQDDRRAGWSTQRLGYLPEPVFGYALAKFARERGEHKPPWAKHLSANLRSDFNQSLRVAHAESTVCSNCGTDRLMCGRGISFHGTTEPAVRVKFEFQTDPVEIKQSVSVEGSADVAPRRSKPRLYGSFAGATIFPCEYSSRPEKPPVKCMARSSSKPCDAAIPRWNFSAWAETACAPPDAIR